MKSLFHLFLSLILFSTSAFAQNIVEVEEVDEPQFYVVVEQMPKFPGGEAEMYKFLGKNIEYPDEAKKKGIMGKVYVRFIIDETGAVTNAEVARGVDPLIDAEALRVINEMPQWEPGRQRGEAVKVQYTLPIIFKLDKPKKPKSNKGFKPEE